MPGLNYFKDQEDTRDYKFKLKKFLGKKPSRREQLLKAVEYCDYRSLMSSVKNQGNLGSCVGFAVTALKEYHENVEFIKENFDPKNMSSEEMNALKTEFLERKYDLSEQWTYWNAKKIDPWGPDVEGTSIRYALKVLHKIGCPPEKGWEYTDSAINIGEPESWTHLIARWNTIESYWRLNSLSDILDALSISGPVLIGVGCYEEIFRPEPDGFVPYPRYPQYCYGGHALLLTGYDKKNSRVFFKNSWGENWGDGGYGSFGFDYMRDFCWDAWATKDHSVVRDMLRGSVSL